MNMFTFDPLQSNIRNLLTCTMATNNVTVQDLAERCACSQQTITRCLAMTDGEWTLDNLFMISNALELSVSFNISAPQSLDAAS